MFVAGKLAAIVAIMAVPVWLAFRAWRNRHRPAPPLTASTLVGQLPDPPDVGGV